MIHKLRIKFLINYTIFLVMFIVLTSAFDFITRFFKGQHIFLNLMCLMLKVLNVIEIFNMHLQFEPMMFMQFWCKDYIIQWHEFIGKTILDIYVCRHTRDFSCFDIMLSYCKYLININDYKIAKVNIILMEHLFS